MPLIEEEDRYILCQIRRSGIWDLNQFPEENMEEKMNSMTRKESGGYIFVAAVVYNAGSCGYSGKLRGLDELRPL